MNNHQVYYLKASQENCTPDQLKRYHNSVTFLSVIYEPLSNLFAHKLARIAHLKKYKVYKVSSNSDLKPGELVLTAKINAKWLSCSWQPSHIFATSLQEHTKKKV